MVTTQMKQDLPLSLRLRRPGLIARTLLGAMTTLAVVGLGATKAGAVSPILQLSPASGPDGSTFSAAVSGFAAAEAVGFTFGGSPTGAACMTNVSGACTANNIQVPILATGSYTVTATGGVSGLSASATFTITGPSLQLSPASGPDGSTFSAAVSGFAAAEAVGFTFGGSPTGAACMTNVSGACTANNIQVPILATGSYTVTATGGVSGLSASATFTITGPSLQLSPASGPDGSTFSAAVSGFAAAEAVGFTFGGSPTGAACMTNVSGACTANNIQVPILATGSYTVTATGGVSGLSASATFTITAGAPSATINFPTSGGSYPEGQTVATSFTCSEGSGGPGLTSCDDNNGTDTVSGGSGTLNTSLVGTFSYTVTATSADGQSMPVSISYTVVPNPTLTKFKPAKGKVGKKVTFTGTNLSGALSVKFNGTTAVITTDTPTKITTKVPAGATTGFVTVTTDGGTATSTKKFKVT